MGGARDLRNFIFAIVVAAAIAGIVAFLTEPIATANYNISRPAAKSDRLDVHQTTGCSPSDEKPDNNCMRNRTTSPRRPKVRTVVVAQSMTELSPSFVAA
jgi:hypothetical protein